MCGICGILMRDSGLAPDRGLIERMRDLIAHRGPDGAGLHLGPGVGLGHRRLSIVDVALGQQPMYSADRRFVIVYNGEVYNHPALKTELETAGVRYRTRSDTETVLHLYERLGERAVERLRGMFALAIWDTVERRLFLARDRYGVKPLYYVHRPDGTLIFGSEIKALLPALGGRAILNREALPDFLANHAPSGEATLFAGIMRLAPGHTLTWQDGRISLRQYWDVPIGDPPEAPSPGSRAEQAIIAEYRERFTEAVRLRLMSDVPLGMFLSGGIDSAAITATMATLVKEPIRTFSVAFAEREANELEYARLVAAAYRTEHREIVVTPAEFFAELPRLVWHEDEPIAHPSSIALYFVSRLASAHVKVVLTGEGSDETLAGYNRYRVTEYNARLGALYRRCVPRFARRGLRRALEVLPATSRLRQRAARTFLMRGADLDELYFDNFAVFGRAALHALLAPDLRAHLAAGRSLRGAPQRAGARVGQAAPVATAVCGRQDLPARVANEAGPDEHGGVHREPCALSRPSADRVDCRPAADDEASRYHDQVDSAASDAGAAAAPNPGAAQNGIPGPGRVVAAWSLAAAAR